MVSDCLCFLLEVELFLMFGLRPLGKGILPPACSSASILDCSSQFIQLGSLLQSDKFAEGDEGDEGQVCPCWCVQKGPFLPCQHGQSCWKVLLMKFMRG